MKTTTIAWLCLLLGSNVSFAQQESGQLRNQHAPQGAQNASEVQPPVIRLVGFRLSNWRTIHGDGTKAARDTLQTLQQIGCEVRESNHGNHLDIMFRCPAFPMIPN